MSGDHIPWFSSKEETNNNNLTTEAHKIHDNSIIRRRQIRSDKCKDIKFPVSKNEQIRLKTACKQADLLYKKIHGYDQKLTQTHYNTLLLIYALKHIDEVNWEREYQVSKTYMHTKPTERDYELIGGPYGLSTKKGISDRKLVYMLVLTVLEIVERKGEYTLVL